MIYLLIEKKNDKNMSSYITIYEDGVEIAYLRGERIHDDSFNITLNDEFSRKCSCVITKNDNMKIVYNK